jgi:hypothetical protein
MMGFQPGGRRKQLALSAMLLGFGEFAAQALPLYF